MNQSPVDLSKLKNILDQSKKVMKKSESIKPVVLSESVSKEIFEDDIPEVGNSTIAPKIGYYTDEQVINSKLPEAVKKAMLEQRIPPPRMPGSFSAEDLGYDENDEKPMNFTVPTPKKLEKLIENRTIAPQNTPKHSSDMITISKTELNEMVNNKLLELLATNYNKTITEDAIKKTINLLIKEGKIVTKKK